MALRLIEIAVSCSAITEAERLPAGVIVFLAKGVRPRTWWETHKARHATRRAILTWSILLGILVVILLSFPEP